MPFGQPAGDGAINLGLAEILSARNVSANVPVNDTVLEAGKELGGEVVGHEQLMVFDFALAIDEDVSASAVGAEEDGFVVNLIGSRALDLVDGLEEGVCDTVLAADELDVGDRRIPLWSGGVDDTQSRALRISSIVGIGKNGDLGDGRGCAVGGVLRQGGRHAVGGCQGGRHGGNQAMFDALMAMGGRRWRGIEIVCVD